MAGTTTIHQAVAPPSLRQLNFSKTKRVVLLVDLYPLLALGNPSSYLRAVAAVASRLLRFPPLSASLFAYKYFFSSLSLIRSTAVLPRCLSRSSISFNNASETLTLLSSSLDSISSVYDWSNSKCRARASHTVSSLLQLIHDYAWEVGNDEVDDDVIGNYFSRIRSNLFIVLSPVGESVHSLADYLELREFDEVFGVVRDTFAARGIHLSWIDVKCDEFKIECSDDIKDKLGDEFVNLKNGIRKMGWGFCSSDVVLLGSALLPLGLIYPKIGVSFDFSNFGDSDKKKQRGELVLGILDVNGVPLECKCCDLQFMSMQSLVSGTKVINISNASKSRHSQSSHVQDSLWVRPGEENIRLHVESVHKYEHNEKFGGSREVILVRECFQELGKNRKKSVGDSIADRVLEMLHGEIGGVVPKNQLPTWQMFLNFLHVKGYWALVSLSRDNDEVLKGHLFPFTTHLAILSMTDADSVSIGERVGPKLPEIDQNICDTLDEGVNESERCFSSQTSSTSVNLETQGEGKITKSQRRLYQELRWSSFCEAALGGSNFDLFEFYIVRHYEKSKKLKFLKCWMKQICKVAQSHLTVLPESKFEASACDVSLSEPSPAEDVAMPPSSSETSETFFKCLSNRIQQGLESGMELQTLAEGVVKSSIHWLRHKFDCENNSGGQVKQNSDGTEAVGDKLIEFLLRAPKEMKKIHQDSDPCSSSENLVREYELQILLRMEILRLDVSTMMEESRKKKMLKQICSLLEIIQYLVAGGIHSHISLYDYVERTIRARYSDELEDVVAHIYLQMDLLPFGDEDETPNLLFNSEDSSQSWRDKNEKHDHNNFNHSVSTEGESLQPFANSSNSRKEIGEDEHTRMLNEAQERRERARRFAPFISKARELQRVWAPKQPKAVKCKHDDMANKSKRKKNKRIGSRSVVCETPMIGNKCTGFSDNSDKCKRLDDLGNSSCSVARALFQDN